MLYGIKKHPQQYTTKENMAYFGTIIPDSALINDPYDTQWYVMAPSLDMMYEHHAFPWFHRDYIVYIKDCVCKTQDLLIRGCKCGSYEAERKFKSEWKN